MLLAGFAAAAAVAALAVSEGAATASDAVRSLAGARSAQLDAGRIAVIDVQRAAGGGGAGEGGDAYVTIALVGGGAGGGMPELAGAWDSAGSPVWCEYARGGAGASAGAGAAGGPAQGPRTIICEPSDGLVVAAGGGPAVRVLP